MSKKLSNFSTDNILCPWINDLLKSLMDQYPDNWEKELQKFFFDFRNKANIYSQSPFDIMYKRRSIAIIQEENKENAGKRFSTRLQNTLNKVRFVMTNIIITTKCDTYLPRNTCRILNYVHRSNNI
jgi:hypothetical protein